MAVAFLIAFAFILRSPLPIPPNFESYDTLGWNLSQGEGFSFFSEELREPYIFRTPGYPLLLAGFYRLFGHHPWIIYLVQVFFHTFTLVWVYSLSRRFLGERTAAVSTFLVAFYPLTAIYVPTILPEVLSTFLVAFSLWLYWKSVSSRSSWLMLLTGLVMGYSALVRPVFALFPLVCIVVTFLVHWSRRESWRSFVLIHVGFLLVLSPWIIRNYQVTGEVIPLSSEAPLQLWLGTMNTGSYANRHWENPLYHPQELIVKSRGDFFFDRDDVPFPVEVRVRDSERLSPISLHYRTKQGGYVAIVPLAETTPGTFRAEIPPHPYGTRVEFFLTFRDPWTPSRFIRYPLREGTYFFYRTEETILADLKGEDLLDIYDVGELSNQLLGTDVTPPESLLRLDLDTDGLLTLEDLRLLLEGLGVTNLISLEPFGQDQIQINFSDGDHLTLPRESGRSKNLLSEIVSEMGPRQKGVLLARFAPPSHTVNVTHFPVGGWSRTVEDSKCGWGAIYTHKFEKFNVIETPEGSNVFKDHRGFVPCILQIGLSGVQQELRTNRSYMALTWKNLGEDLGGYIKAALIRVPRLWLTVGQGDAGQTYSIPGGSLSYSLLRVSSIALLLLAVAGFLIKIKTWRTHFLLAVPVLYLSFVHAPFHPEGRYSIPGRPFLLIYVAITLLALWDGLRKRRQKTR